MINRYFILIALLISFISSSQGLPPKKNENLISAQVEKQVESPIYRLSPTENYWTFIKLDTRNGKMWQVHFTISQEGYEGELILNSSSLVLPTEEVSGRFVLYPTKNTYNFILLDQINGNTYQVQWNSDKEKRFVSRI